MRHLCLIGGMDIKSISLIFSRYRFAVQEKEKANKPQTQKKLLLLIYSMGVSMVLKQTQGPRRYRGPRPALPPAWHCLLDDWGPAPAQNLN